MKKVSLFFAALFLVGMTLVSCGGSGSTESTSDSATMEQAQPETAPAADSTATAAPADTTMQAQ